MFWHQPKEAIVIHYQFQGFLLIPNIHGVRAIWKLTIFVFLLNLEDFAFWKIVIHRATNVGMLRGDKEEARAEIGYSGGRHVGLGDSYIFFDGRPDWSPSWTAFQQNSNL